MSKVFFVAYEQHGEILAHCIAHNGPAPLDGDSYKRWEPDPPPSAGIWVWQGWSSDSIPPDGFSPWRRPTPYELAEISEGRWPEKTGRSTGMTHG